MRQKVWNAFTGGKPTAKEQRELGGDPSICTVYAYFYYLFEEDDKKIVEVENSCRLGQGICGECKERLAELVNRFLKDHQRKREAARSILDKFFVS